MQSSISWIRIRPESCKDWVKKSKNIITFLGEKINVNIMLTHAIVISNQYPTIKKKTIYSSDNK